VPQSQRIGLRAGLVASVVTGLTLGLAFPPYGIWPLAPLAVAASTRVARGQTVRRALLLGMVTGLAFFGLLLRWLTVIGPDAWILLSALEAAFVAVMFVGVAHVQRLRLWPLWTACLWVAAELARSYVPFGGFPWGRLAFSQAGTPFAPLAALGGMPVLTFAVALSGALLLAQPLQQPSAPAVVAGGAGQRRPRSGDNLDVAKRHAAPQPGPLACADARMPFRRACPEARRETLQELHRQRDFRQQDQNLFALAQCFGHRLEIDFGFS